MISLADENLSVVKQCELLGLSRSTYYYEPIPESPLNLKLMKMIDQQYLITPFYGSRSMRMFLKKNGESVNRKRIQRLMRTMGLEAMYPKPKTSIGNKEDYKFPYLLKDLIICRPNQVWGTDITYIPLNEGFLYLSAIIDLYSRYVLAWELSDNLEVEFCIRALEKALRKGKPEIFNSDQGAQYTSKSHTELLKDNGIRISMSGRGRCWDNIFVERLWRSLKYEEVYLKNYVVGTDVDNGMGWYFNFYNGERLHSSLDYRTPEEVYEGIKVVEPFKMKHCIG